MFVSPKDVSRESRRIWEAMISDARLHPDWISEDNSISVYVDGCTVALLRHEGHGLITVLGNGLIGDDGDGASARFASGLADLLELRTTSVIRFNDIPRNGLFLAMKGVKGATLVHDREPTPHMYFDMPATVAEFWSKFSSSTRKTFQKRIREISGGFVRYDSPDGLPALRNAMNVVYPKTWQSKHTLSHFLSLPNLWGFLAERGLMRCFVLYVRDEPMAFHVGCLWNGHHIGIEQGYNSWHPEIKAGTTLTCMLMVSLIEEGKARVFDWGWGGDSYKQMFSNRQTENVRAKLVANRLIPQMVSRSSQAAIEARAVLSRGMKAIGVFDKARRSVHWVESNLFRKTPRAGKL